MAFKKKLLLASGVLLFLFGVFGSAPWIVKGVLCYKAQKAGYTLSYANLKLTYKSLTLTQVKLVPQNKGKIEFEADTLVFSWGLKKTIDLAAINPHVTLLEKDFSFSSERGTLINLLPFSGSFSLWDKKNQTFFVEKGAFSFDGKRFFLGILEEKELSCNLAAKEEVFFEFFSLPLEAWGKVASFWEDYPVQIQGKLSGVISLNKREKAFQFAKFRLDDFEGKILDKRILLEKGEIYLQASSPPPSFFRSFLFSDWEKLQASIFLQKASFFSENEAIFTEATIKVTQEPSIGSKMQMQAITSEEQKLKMQGKAFFFSSDHNWIEIKASFSEGLEENWILLQGKEKQGKVTLQLNTPKLVAKEGRFLQKIGSIFSPQVKSYSWEEGKLEADLEVCFEPQLKKVALKRVKVENLTLFDPNFAKACLGSASLQGEISLEKGQKKIDFLKANLTKASGTLASFSLEKVEGSLEIENDYFLPTQVKAYVNHLPVELQIKGKTSFVEMVVKSQGESSAILACFPQMANPGESFLLESYITLQPQRLSFFTKIDLEKDKTTSFQMAWEIPFLQQEEKKQGWVLAENCDVHRCNGFWEASTSLGGTGSFFLQNQGRKFYLKGVGENLQCKTEEIHLGLPTTPVPFSFWWEIGKGSYEHDLFLQEATVYLPEKDLLFTQVEGKVEKRKETFFAELTKALCEEVTFQAEASFHKTTEDIFFTVLVKHMEGSLPCAQKFSTHFFPEAGKVSFTEGEFFSNHLYAKGSMNQKEPVVWCLDGEVKKGKIAFFEPRTLENLSTKIKKTKGGKLWLSELKAQMTLGREPPLCLFSPYVCWEKGVAYYDIRLENPVVEMLRLKGDFRTAKEGNWITLCPESSHLLGKKLEIETCAFTSSNSLKNFKITTQLDLSKIYYLAGLLEKEAFFPLKGKKPWMEKLAGTLDISLCLGEKNTFQASSSSLQYQKLGQAPLEIFAEKKTKEWEVTTFQFGNFTGKAAIDLQAEAHSFATFALEETDRFKLKGDLCWCEDSKISGNLSTLWFKTESFPSFFRNLQGDIEATGCFFFDLKKENGLQVDLDLNPQKINWKHLTLYNENKAFFRYSPQEGALVKGLNLKLFSPDVDLSSLFFKVDTLHLKEELFLEKAQVYVEGDLSSFIEKSFQASKKSLPFSLKWLQDKQKNLEWSGDIHLALQENTLALNLKEAYFPIGTQVCHFQNLFLKYDPNECFLQGKYFQEKVPSEFEVKLTFSPHLKGMITLKGLEKVEPLMLKWSWEEGSLPRLHEIKGSFYGIEASLFEKSFSKQQGVLLGSIYFNFEKLKPWFPEKVQEVFDSCSLGEGYELKGDFSYGESPSFKGILSGKEIELGGFQFKTLLAQMNWEENLLEVKDLKLSDASGTLKIDSLQVRNMALGHELTIPTISLKEFRPCLMRKKGKELEALTPFLIRTLTLKNVKGFIEDLSSFTGQGKCYFINSFKREPSVFDIPSDVIGRIFGLDLELLIPVKGEVDIELKKGKFFLTSLKDAYSENHRSKFFFVEKDSLPYIDLKGDIYINVKMKQYVLFKITENFIIKIRGKINEPNFSLNRKKSFFSS